jgi:hypothetical protein
MSTNSAPIYGKQYIRYAETWEAAVNAEAGSPAATAAGTTIGIVEVGELRCVSYLVSAGSNIAAAGDAFTAAPTTIAGVNQAYMPTTLAQPYTARQLTVATSGLLLIEVDPDAGTIALNTPLEINVLGQATDSGTAVTLDGTTPTIREIVDIASRTLVLVSFA